jgi:hypothetical protein
MMAKIIDAAAIRPYTVYIKFKDGVEGAVDLSYLLQRQGVFEPLSDKKYFAKMRFDEHLGTICWPNGADICPDVLYEKVKSKK